MMEVVLPYPPTINHYWLRRRSGGVRLSDAARDFRIAVAIELRGHPKLLGRLAVSIAAYPPDRRRRDIDNILKPVLDALEHAGVFENDNQVKRLLVEMHDIEPVKGGEMVVRIEELN